MGWIDLAQDKGQWKALVNTVINLRIPYNDGKFLAASREGLNPMELVRLRKLLVSRVFTTQIRDFSTFSVCRLSVD
jgi:hypothetical protein